MRAQFPLIAVLILAVGRGAESPRPLTRDQIAEDLRPVPFQQVCLSADGRYAAYAEGNRLFVLDVDRPAVSRTVFQAPSALAWVGWSAGRLVLEDASQSFYALNPDGTGRIALADPQRFGYDLGPPPAPGFRDAMNAAEQEMADYRQEAENPPYAGTGPGIKAMAGLPAGKTVNIGSPGKGGDAPVQGNPGDAPVFEADLGVETSSRFYPRKLQLLACRQAWHFVVIEAEGIARSNVPTEFFRLDTISGQQKRLAKMRHVPQGMLVDQQGNPRIAFARQGESSEVDYVSLAGRKIPGSLATPVSPRTLLGARSLPLAFSSDGDILYYASNSGRDTYGIYAWNLATHRPLAVRIEDPVYDLIDPFSPFPAQGLLFDPATGELTGIRALARDWVTRWLDPKLARLQSLLEERLPHRALRIEGWNAARTRLLVRSEAPDRPVRYYLYLADADHLIQFLHATPSLDSDALSATSPLALVEPDGARLTGHVTEAQHQRLTPPPLVVILHDGPWERVRPDFDTESQLISRMGFVVARINYRGSIGFGSRFRALLGRSWISGPLDDVDATIAWLAAQKRIDPARVSLLGHGYGAFIALQALKSRPGRYASAIAVASQSDIQGWLTPPPDGADWQTHLQQVEQSQGSGLGQEFTIAPPKASVFDNAIWDATRSYTPLDRAWRQDLFAAEPAVFRAAAALRARHLVGDRTLVMPTTGSEWTVPEMALLQDFLNLSLYDQHVRLGVPRVEE